MIDAQRSLNGIGRAEYHRILVDKHCGIPAEITHFKTLPVILPVIPRCQLRPEQPQGLLGKLVHLCVKSVVFQLAVQFLLFGLQFPPLHGIKLTLQIGNDQFRGTKKQFERTAIESEHDGELLQKS